MSNFIVVNAIHWHDMQNAAQAIQIRKAVPTNTSNNMEVY